MKRQKQQKETAVFAPQDHTFVICAYRENPFLEACIQSVLGQTVLGKVLISTSTPNDCILGLAEKYHLPVKINYGPDSAPENLNFGYSQAETRLVTLCHQDDYFYPQYLETMLLAANRAVEPIILFSDYAEERQGKIARDNVALRIKRVMNAPLLNRHLQNSVRIRRRLLSFGNAICCPSVTFNRDKLEKPPFETTFRNSYDWDAWEKLSRKEGAYVYCPEKLVVHRIWQESATTSFIGDGTRTQNDYEILCRFWPKSVASVILKLYRKAEKLN